MPLLNRPWTWAAVGAVALAVFLLTQGGEAEDKKDKNADEVPMLGGTPSRNMANLTAKNVLDDFAVRPKGKEKNIKWVAEMGSYSYGGPVLAGGKFFVGTNNDNPRDKDIKGDKGVLMCFRESDGKFLWQIVHDKGDEASDYAKQGIISTPCVEGDRIYYVSNRGEVVCADVNGDEKTGKGKIIWSYDMVKELDVFVGQASSSSPVVFGDNVYALTGNGVEANSGKLIKPKAPSFVAVNKKTGKLVWSSNLPGENLMRGSWSNPAAAKINGQTQILFGGGDGWMYSFDEKGTLLWKFDCNPKKATEYKPGGGGEKCFIVATPVIHDNKCYIAVGQEPDDGSGVGHLWCIDMTKKPANKDKDLSPVNDNFDPNAAVNKNSGLVWHHGGPVLPKPKEGREEILGRTLGTVAIADGVLYVSELAGYMQALDAKTGKKLWEHDFTEETWCSPFYVDGKVFLGTNTGSLYVFKAGRAHNEPKKISFGRALKVPPLVANGVLYVNTGMHLYAFAEKK